MFALPKKASAQLGRSSLPTNLLAWLTMAILMTISVLSAQEIAKGIEQSPQTPNLKPGDYVWQPEASPAGPVVLVVNLSKQELEVYRNGLKIGHSTISSGKEGHLTPAGIFTILQKQIDHHSSVYHEATMPYTERLTWGGVAIHAGSLPGYPDSHGCVHVPMDFAKKLYEITANGTTVLVTNGDSSSVTATKTDLVFSATKATTPLPPSSTGVNTFSWHPEASPAGPLCVVVSTADKQVYINRNGVEIGRCTISGEQAHQSVGNHVYAALDQFTPEGFHRWNLLGSLETSSSLNIEDLLQQLEIPAPFRDDMRQVVTPGSTLVITDQPVDQGNPNKSGADILDAD